MNINDYRDALNEITPNNELKEHIMNMKTPQKRYISTRRVFAYALAAVMTLTCLFTVAQPQHQCSARRAQYHPSEHRPTGKSPIYRNESSLWFIRRLTQ